MCVQNNYFLSQLSLNEWSFFPSDLMLPASNVLTIVWTNSCIDQGFSPIIIWGSMSQFIDEGVFLIPEHPFLCHETPNMVKEL